MQSNKLNDAGREFDVGQFQADAICLTEDLDRIAKGVPRDQTLLERLRQPDGLAMPSKFLLEFSAVCYIACWEAAGMTNYLAMDVPNYQDAIRALRIRVADSPESFFGEFELPDLFARVLEAYWRSFDHSRQLPGDVLVGPLNAEGLLEALAAFLWRNRGKVSQFTGTT